MSETVIKVEGLGKKYIIGHQGKGGYKTFRDQIGDSFNTVFSKTKQMLSGQMLVEGDEVEEFWALKDVSFEVKKGETLGIIGRNGAGKSTLLKILSRITEPTTGKVILKGRVASLLEVGTGFHPELSGRENIFLNGAILGMSRAEIKRKFDEIVDFSGVEKFLDTPVKRYSSGMYVRLAFAVAAHLEPEILIIDEVLAVGDAEFQKKCLGKMDSVTHQGRTILFVSHDLSAINQLCRRGILLKNGGIQKMGEMTPVIDEYLNFSDKLGIYVGEGNEDKPLYFKKIFLASVAQEIKNEFGYDDSICINFELGINKSNIRCCVFVIILDHFKRRIFSCESKLITEKMRLTIDRGFLVRGTYSIHTFIHIPRVEQIDVAEDVCNFTVVDNGSIMSKHGDYDYGVVFGRYAWD